MDEQQWIWIHNWEKFQHYKQRQPTWIKVYVELLGDDRYLSLTSSRRGLLHGLHLAFTWTRLELPLDLKKINTWLRLEAKMTDIEALNHAGFIEILASSVLAERLQGARAALASRAPARSPDVEKEVEEKQPTVVSASSTRSDETEAAAPALNGRAALVDHEDDIPLPAVKTAPKFPCPHCDHSEDTWSGYTLHLTLDHPEVPA
jgi:hypothetical protein